MNANTTDVLICGAGAAGLTLAIELARRDIRFRLIDKAATPFPGSRGKGIQPRTQEVFDDLGIVDRAFGAGGLYPRLRTYKDGGFTDSEFTENKPPTPAEPYMRPLMLPQFLTEAIMRERLAEFGYRPHFGCELIRFEQDADGVTATVRSNSGEETIRARYLVGSDGGRSFVRQALGIDFPGNSLGIRAVVADVLIDGLSDDVWHRWGNTPADSIALSPLRGTDLFQLQGAIPFEGEVDLSARGLHDMIAARTHRTDIPVHAVAWASAYAMSARLADRFRVGRVFLAGDAAHVHPPTGGQGLNTSIQDAYNLGWKLAAVLRGAPDLLLDSYEAERRPIAADVLGLSKKLLDEGRRGQMRRERETHQLDLGYPDSPLSFAQSLETDKIAAGDRAPDAPCCGAGGQSTRLFGLFRGPHWTLLGYGVPRSAAIASRPGLHIHTTGGRGDITDDGGHIRDAYGLTTGWVLVRPDGYVSAIVSDPACLERHLESVGVPRPG
ncbi:MAG TPA: FAD-dependent oxidoreductase [Rhizomicrobium sp.]|nr:FAD-dependent oxidoreductase [Rhizomicrobium sp.]